MVTAISEEVVAEVVFVCWEVFLLLSEISVATLFSSVSEEILLSGSEFVSSKLSVVSEAEGLSLFVFCRIVISVSELSGLFSHEVKKFSVFSERLKESSLSRILLEACSIESFRDTNLKMPAETMTIEATEIITPLEIL